uniref:Prephenate dehydratase domain-containing protein n=1 Tax=Oryza glaberrima TaxID=4538 RepID=I1QIV0_ORYGL
VVETMQDGGFSTTKLAAIFHECDQGNHPQNRCVTPPFPATNPSPPEDRNLARAHPQIHGHLPAVRYPVLPRPLSDHLRRHLPSPRVNGDSNSIKPALADHTAQLLDLDLLPGAHARKPPGAYSEAAAAKAYPSCDAIPCDQFEVAFQAVELWIADHAVLLVKNSSHAHMHYNQTYWL